MLIITSGIYGLALGDKAVFGAKGLLAKAPPFKAKELLQSKYYAGLGKFVNDLYPHRIPIRAAKSWIDYNIFHTSPSIYVHIGKDGWFYLDIALDDYFKNNCNERKKARNLARKLHAIEKEAEAEGKKFIFIVPPDKATIYPEHVGLPRNPGACGKNFYDLFLEALQRFPVHGFIRLDRILLNKKKDYQLYYAKDSHWNDRTSAFVSKIILERLTTPSRRFSLPKMEFREERRVKDLMWLSVMSLKETSEYFFNIEEKGKVTVKRLRHLPNGNSHLKISSDALPGRALLPRALIYRDSFMISPLKLIGGSFAEIDALWARSIPVSTRIDFPMLRDSKIIIIEVVERELPHLRLLKKNLIMAMRGEEKHKRDSHPNSTLNKDNHTSSKNGQ